MYKSNWHLSLLAFNFNLSALMFKNNWKIINGNKFGLKLEIVNWQKECFKIKNNNKNSKQLLDLTL